MPEQPAHVSARFCNGKRGRTWSGPSTWTSSGVNARIRSGCSRRSAPPDCSRPAR